MSLNQDIMSSFGEVSGFYDSVLPNYPLEMVDHILTTTNMPHTGNILDVGIGTGKSTEIFAPRSFEIVGLDINRRIIKVAQQKLSKYSNVHFMIGAFEKADLPKKHFDLIISGQTFHWVDPTVGYIKLHDILKEDGHIALFWNFLAYELSKMLLQIRELYKKYSPDFDEHLNIKCIALEEIEASGLFVNVESKNYLRVLKYDKERFLKLLDSMEWVYELPNDRKRDFFRDVKGILDMHDGDLNVPYRTELIVARKKLHELDKVCR